ncbi:MAG: alpha/beta hydrolase [Spirosomaceae bacterium]|nr:alpha/beta hydrolase [Spirosomataceae bacterium]
MQRLLTIAKFVLLGCLTLALLGFWIGYQSDIPAETLKAKYAPAPSQFMAVEGLEVHYRDEGTPRADSLPLVLIHGTGASLHTWDGWVAELRDDFRLIRLDMPAYGLTGPNATNDYNLEYYARFLHKFLQQLNVQKCYLAGNSLGGAIAWRFALLYPETTQKLILIDAGGYTMSGKTKSTSVPLAFRIARMPALKNVVKYVTPRFIAENSLKNVYFDDSKVTPELIDRYWQMTLREGNRAAFLARMNPRPERQDDSWQQIKTIQAPTLIQWGQHDGLITLDVAKRFQADLPHDTLIVYPNAGHVPMEEIPQQTAHDAKRFLREKP